jgi:2-polyprenyl-6-methoxyphenol hydroxylase-like FAD-dependent oxidoreductase
MKGESIEDILIIGAGPSGLFVAAELARHGVRARLIEKDLTPHAQSRATGVQPATLEVLQRAGMLDGLLAAAQRIDGMQILDGRLEPAFATSLAGMDTPYSFVASLPQCRTESLLEAHLRRLGGAPERGVLVEGVELDAAGSRVAVRHADGTRESIYARYLIGAGGAHCPVRAAMHEHLDGTTYPFRYLVADISGDIRLDPHTLCVAISCVGIVMLVPLPAERWLAVIDLCAVGRLRRPRAAPRRGAGARGAALELAVPYPSPDRPALRRWPALPARRCRAHLQPVRRRGDERRPAGRGRSRLEAGAGDEGPGAAVGAGRL